MLKIEQFVEQQFGIKLTKHQLEIIAIIAANPEKRFVIQSTGRSAGKTTAYKAAMAYLQDGLKPLPPQITIHDVKPPQPDVRFIPVDRGMI